MQVTARHSVVWGVLLAVALMVGCSEDVAGDDPAAAATPDVQVTSRDLPPLKLVEPVAADFGFDPGLGIVVHKRHILLSLLDDYTAKELGEVLQVAGGELIGTVPVARILQLDMGEGFSFDAMRLKLQALNAHRAVAAAVQDTLLFPMSAPKPNTNSFNFDWEWSTTPGGANWGLEYIHAPAAWNLMRRIEGNAKPRVTVIDVGFMPHPDLPGSSFTLNIPSPIFHDHGTAVSGAIGAKWNGQYTDGIAPHVEIAYNYYADIFATIGSILNVFNPVGHRVTTMTSNVRNVVSQAVFSNGPRIINMSLGYNWYAVCFPVSGAPKGRRCDPRLAAQLQPNACANSGVDALIMAQGQIFGDLVQGLNSRAPLLIVVAAGNDSDPLKNVPAAAAGAPLTADFCLNKCICKKTEDGDEPKDCNGGNAVPACDTVLKHSGLGPFRAHLASPMTNAAILHPGARPHMIVVQASQLWPGAVPPITTGASFSNINGKGVFAPGHRIGVLEGLSSVKLSNGTSIASPYVAGAAAHLLGIEPTLNNAQLKTLLTDPKYTVGTGGAPPPTAMHIDLFKATMGIDDFTPTKPKRVQRWLADIDDGTDDGFQRLTYDNNGKPLGGHFIQDRQRGGALTDTPLVDMRDFRRLRDNIHLATQFMVPGTGALSGVPWTHKKMDLNFDGVQPTTNFSQEFWPRADLNGDGRVDNAPAMFKGKNMTDIEVMAGVFDSSQGPQPWPASALSKLLDSFDLQIRAQDAIKADNADAVILQIVQDDNGTLPAAWNTASLAKGLLGPTTPYGDGILIKKGVVDKLVLTAPIFAGVRVRWAFIKNNQPPAASDWQSHQFILPAEGQDVIVHLKGCGKPPVAVINATGASFTQVCSGPKFFGCCVTCGGCLGVTAPLSAAGSYDPEGKKLTYKWGCSNFISLCGVVGATGQTAKLNYAFKHQPFCPPTKGIELVNVTLEVSDGCHTTKAVKSLTMECPYQLNCTL